MQDHHPRHSDTNVAIAAVIGVQNAAITREQSDIISAKSPRHSRATSQSSFVIRCGAEKKSLAKPRAISKTPSLSFRGNEQKDRLPRKQVECESKACLRISSHDLTVVSSFRKRVKLSWRHELGKAFRLKWIRVACWRNVYSTVTKSESIAFLSTTVAHF